MHAIKVSKPYFFAPFAQKTLLPRIRPGVRRQLAFAPGEELRNEPIGTGIAIGDTGGKRTRRCLFRTEGSIEPGGGPGHLRDFGGGELFIPLVKTNGALLFA